MKEEKNTKSLDELLKKLKDEKFKREVPEWKDALWGNVEVLCAEDKNNWYYIYKNSIYFQAKEGDYTPHCYGCGSIIKFKRRTYSIWYKEFSGPIGGGGVKVRHIPYCPKCEEEPGDSGISIH